ncbi:type IIL restriction-modification enzyme MmeI [Paludisphaera soli]|uniref:type IIL restriction-modification enzyme MmeI n=1 Tax=Paludisphaera soli TaxID=2712865 RepID=UPI0019807136|nr:type IIL restriction-modification enzyme MmeI [Paludisphaera soli]
MVEVDVIGPALSAGFDVIQAVRLRTNIESGACYQGQTHGHEGFLLSPAEADALLQSPGNAQVLFPYLTGDDLLSNRPPAPQRYVIDLQPRDILEAGRYSQLLDRLKASVLPTRQAAAAEEAARNEAVLGANPKAKVNQHHRNFLNRWWLLSYPRPELIARISTLPRYIVCSQVTKRPTFEFIETRIRPNAALIVFPLPDDYSFGILQSGIHWAWFVARCSTLKGDFRYTSDTVFDTFPWPQGPTLLQVEKVAEAAVALRRLRREVMCENSWSLRELYRTLDIPGHNPLRSAQEALDAAVRAAYGMRPKDDPLAFLLALNGELADRKASLLPVVGPGLPPVVKDVAGLVTEDCITIAR